MRLFIRKTLVKILATGMKVAVAVYRIFRQLGRLTGAGLSRVSRPLFTLSLPIFHVVVSAKRTLRRLWAPLEQRTRLLHLFTRRYFYHLTFVGIALTVATANLNVYEVKRDELTYSNVFTSLGRDEDYDEIEEVRPPTIPTSKRYLRPAAVEPGVRSTAGIEEQELSPGTIAGGSALVKPIRLPSGVSVADLPAGVPRTDVVTYTVQEDDTISGIATKFGISVNTILWENNLTPYTIIRAGQNLTILPVSGLRHKVAGGENLGKISSRYGVEVADIIAANKLASADDLQVGELLLIPGGTKPRPTPTYALRWPGGAPPPVTGGGRLLWPATCRRITQYFGWRHTGIDIACPYGSAVYAAESGRVIKAQGGWNGGYGIIIVVQHADGTQTLYGHNSKLYVQVGDEVVRGQTISAIGSSGRSTGPHVHFEVRQGGYRRNPFSFLR